MSSDIEEWNEETFSDVIEINDYPSVEKGEKYKAVGMADLARNKRKIQNWEEKEYSYSRPRFRNGQTLMARITPCLENGKTAYVDVLDENETAIGSTEFIVLSDTKKTTPKFVYYTARRPEIRKFAIKRMNGTSGRQRVPIDCFQNKKIDLPPLNEQEKIVEILDNIDSKIEANNKAINKLKEISENYFVSQLIEFENYEGETKYDEEFEKEVPKDWNKKSLSEIAEFMNGKAWQKYEAQNKSNKLPVVKIEELRNGITSNSNEVDLEAAPESHIIEDGDVLFSWSASLVLEIWGDGEAFLNQHLFKVTSDEYPKWFFYEWVNHHIRKFKHIAEAKKTTMGHIKRDDLQESKVLIPGDEKLEELSGKLKPLFNLIIEKEVENRKLEELRDTLLPKLMSGELRVEVDEDE